MKKGKKIGIIILIPVLIAALAAAGYFIMQRIELKNAPDPGLTAEKYNEEIFEAIGKAGETELLEGLNIKSLKEPESPEGKLLYESFLENLSYELEGEAIQDGRKASQKIKIISLNPEKLSEGIDELMMKKLSEKIKEAAKPSEIYNEDKSYKEELLNEVFLFALNEKLGDTDSVIEEKETVMELEYKDKNWNIENGTELKDAILGWAKDKDFDEEAEKIQKTAEEGLEYIAFRYKIEETALQGPVPNQENFLVTKDPADIALLLETEEAKNLIGDKKLIWSPEIERIPGRDMYCNLDETILVICWQQVEAKAVGTYSEVIVADGSQLRRKIGGDAYEDFNHKTTTEFAIDCNAVLTMGGDFYHHDRNCGIVVYNREILRFDPSTCDTCYITSSGDMLFSYRDQFSTWEEAQQFVDDNDVRFSLAFGPVLIDEYQDVCPDNYPWGEINDHYARSGLGLFEDGHYLGVNINCEMPDYYYLVTLRDLADAMQRAGCRKAYTLDGGQTATTVFNQQLINPVQFGWEKPISDVIYFASAVPNE